MPKPRAIERRLRKVYVPGTLAPIAAVRPLFASPLAERIMKRQARRLIPTLEGEVQALGRAFGASSVGLGERENAPTP